MRREKRSGEIFPDKITGQERLELMAAVGTYITKYQMLEDLIDLVFTAGIKIDKKQSRIIFSQLRGLEPKIIATSAMLHGNNNVTQIWNKVVVSLRNAFEFRNKLAHSLPTTQFIDNKDLSKGSELVLTKFRSRNSAVIKYVDIVERYEEIHETQNRIADIIQNLSSGNNVSELEDD